MKSSVHFRDLERSSGSRPTGVFDELREDSSTEKTRLCDRYRLLSDLVQECRSLLRVVAFMRRSKYHLRRRSFRSRG